MDTMSLDKILIQFIVGFHQHWAQRENDITKVLNILNEKELSLKTIPVAITIVISTPAEKS